MSGGRELKNEGTREGKGCRVGRERGWGVIQLYGVDSEGRNEQQKFASRKREFGGTRSKILGYRYLHL